MVCYHTYGGIIMKSRFILRLCLCLLTSLLLLGGCTKEPDLTGYHAVGETFTLSHSDKFEYNVTLLEINDAYFTVQLEKVHLIDDAKIYIYSSNIDKLISNGVEYSTEEHLPIPLLMGVYSVPLATEDMVLQIYHRNDIFKYSGNGYIKAEVDTAGSSEYYPKFGIRFYAY